MGVNSRYKDSLFTFLFSNPDALRELYSALEGVDLPPDTPVTINTLTDILYMGQINDISFTVDNRMVVLIEHQSTINPNMPLRLLMYCAKIYEKIIDPKKKYQMALEKIPSPEFIVLYNGIVPFPDHKILKLSESFIDPAGLKAAGSPALELTVQVYNINKGHNQEWIQKSKTLEGYSSFIAQTREYEKTMPFEDAIKAAIKYCTEHDILRHFLETHSSEVFNMLLDDWNMDDARAAWLEEGREEGIEIGLEKGRERILQLLNEGLSTEQIRQQLEQKQFVT